MSNEPFFDSTEVPEFVRDSDTGEVSQAMTATSEPESAAKMEFHVQMKAWTMEGIETFIIAAAADQLVRRFFPDRDAKKLIEDRLMATITGKLDRMLGEITAEIIDHPVTVNYGKNAVTMRDMIGLHGREYLTQKVDSYGKATTSTYDGKPRIERIVSAAVEVNFKREVEKSTSSVITEIQKSVKTAYEEFLAKEKARVAQVVAKIGAAE